MKDILGRDKRLERDLGIGIKKKEKRTLGITDKKILYRNAEKRCENPKCKRKIDFDEMQVGHLKAYSKGGKTTLKNSVCLCYRCNNLQGTSSWAKFMKKQGIEIKKPKKKVKKKAKKKIKRETYLDEVMRF